MLDNQSNKIDRLIEIRHENGLNQQSMADLLGVPRTSLTKIEGKEGNRKVPKGTHLVLQYAFGVNPDWFETGIGEKRLTLESALSHFSDLLKKWKLVDSETIVLVRRVVQFGDLNDSVRENYGLRLADFAEKEGWAEAPDKIKLYLTKKAEAEQLLAEILIEQNKKGK